MSKKQSPEYMIMYTANGYMKILFWIVIPLMKQQVTKQLQLLICDTKAKAGILFYKDAFNQSGCLQNYTNRILCIE